MSEDKPAKPFNIILLDFFPAGRIWMLAHTANQTVLALTSGDINGKDYDRKAAEMALNLLSWIQD